MSSSRRIELLKGLEAAPFYLQQEDLEWVEKVFGSMSLEEKIGQLFCPIGFSTDPGYLQGALLRHHIGGLFFRNGESSEMQETFRYAQSHSKIPLLIPSNLEAGGNGAATDGTAYGMPLAVAATKDSKYAYRLGKVACSEGAAIGINWAFAPVVDIDLNCHNPITNVRTFGSQAEVVYRCASQYLKAAKEENVAVSIKHFPGDGVDERDQHLLTSINSLSCEEWDESFGMVYKKLIEEDALTVMAGHIALPSYQGFFNAETAKQVIPASLSKELLYDLLRKQLGFNGMIVTDASPMLGFTCAMERAKAVPYSIECGCDMFLFNKDLEEDYGFMLEGYKTGILSEERLEEAVLRILGLKAALKLHTKKADNSLVPNPEQLQKVGCIQHKEWAKELADASITLVKDAQKIIPICVENNRRVLLQILGDFDSNERIRKTVEVELEKRGFIVSHYEKEDFSKPVDNVTAFRAKYDMVLYIANVENASNKTTNRINWYTFFGQGNNAPWFVKEVPTVFVSVANPYHLLDVPMMSTYINAYSNYDQVLESVIAKLVGESEFVGASPIDPFCQREDLSW